MKRINDLIIFSSIIIPLIGFSACQDKETPLAIHPDNHKYFIYKGKPTVLIGSTEHYGALMNLAFDYKVYFETLKTEGLNTTRTFTGVYTEVEEWFGIVDNTMAVDSGMFTCPWARSEIPGYRRGGNKFDLNQWDDAYFERLHDYMRTAHDNNVIVEVVLFSNNYFPYLWEVSPMHPDNNINITDSVDIKDALSLKHADLFEFQTRYVKKMVKELNRHPNFYYEICNEPYIFGHVGNEWQNAIIDTLVKTQSGLPNQHLISINYENGSHRIEALHPAVSIVNFHYVAPPDAVALNADIKAVIGHNETGGRMVYDKDFVREGWDFIIAGGAIFNHLDYSFTVEHPRGTRVVGFEEPSGGGPQLRKELGNLRNFIESFDFIKMKADTSCVKSTLTGRNVRVLSNPGKEYAVFVRKALSTAENISVRFSTRLIPDYSEEYTFYISCNDGARVYFNGEKMIDLWTDWGSSGSFTYTPEKRKPVDMVVEYYKKVGPATILIEWESKSQPREEIKEKNYLLPDKDENGVRATLFNDSMLGVFVAFEIFPTITYSGTPDEFSGEQESNNNLELEIENGNYTVEMISIETGLVESLTEQKVINNSLNLEITALNLAIRIKRKS